MNNIKEKINEWKNKIETYPNVVDINILLKKPKGPYIKGKAQIGHYYIESSLYGYYLFQIINEKGGVEQIFFAEDKRDLLEKLRILEYGIGEGINIKKKGNKKGEK